ncbi:hypothetical protein ACTMSW_08490 [Micromonospora sp. BQ11]
MRSWMRGNVDWSSRTHRYRPAEGSGGSQPAEYLEPALLGEHG